MKSRYQNTEGSPLIAFKNENGIEHIDDRDINKPNTKEIEFNNDHDLDKEPNANNIKLIETKVTTSNKLNQLDDLKGIHREFDPKIINSLPIHMNPVISPQMEIYDSKYNLHVGYGSLKVNGLNKLETMEDANNMINHISELNKDQIKELLHFLNTKNKLLIDQKKSMSDQSQKYVKESILILGNIQNEVLESQSEIDSIFKPLQGDMKSKAISELESKYINNLSGFVVDKSRYPLAEKIDPIDLSTYSTNLRRSLGSNKDFYLFGDSSLMN